MVSDGSALAFSAGSLRLPLQGSHAKGAALFAVRPQRLSLHRQAPQTPSIQGVLLKTAYLGTHLEHNVQTEFGDMLIIDTDVDRELTPRETVYIGLDARASAIVPA